MPNEATSWQAPDDQGDAPNDAKGGVFAKVMRHLGGAPQCAVCGTRHAVDGSR